MAEREIVCHAGRNGMACYPWPGAYHLLGEEKLHQLIWKHGCRNATRSCVVSETLMSLCRKHNPPRKVSSAYLNSSRRGELIVVFSFYSLIEYLSWQFWLKSGAMAPVPPSPVPMSMHERMHMRTKVSSKNKTKKLEKEHLWRTLTSMICWKPLNSLHGWLWSQAMRTSWETSRVQSMRKLLMNSWKVSVDMVCAFRWNCTSSDPTWTIFWRIVEISVRNKGSGFTRISGWWKNAEG